MYASQFQSAAQSRKIASCWPNSMLKHACFFDGMNITAGIQRSAGLRVSKHTACYIAIVETVFVYKHVHILW